MLYNLVTSNPEVMIAIISAIISSISAFLSWYLFKRSHRLQSIDSIRNYHEKLREWASDVLDVIVQSEYLCSISPEYSSRNEYFEKRESLEATLSSLIDKGRWFLPNEENDKIGRGWPAAYQGFRSPILDDLVNVYRLIETIKFENKDENIRIKKLIYKSRRDFVSHIFEEINVRTSKELFNEQISSLRVSKKL